MAAAVLIAAGAGARFPRLRALWYFELVFRIQHLRQTNLNIDTGVNERLESN